MEHLVGLYAVEKILDAGSLGLLIRAGIVFFPFFLKEGEGGEWRGERMV
jgi:hypothetical protein